MQTKILEIVVYDKLTIAIILICCLIFLKDYFSPKKIFIRCLSIYSHIYVDLLLFSVKIDI